MSVLLLRHTRLAAVAGLCYGHTDVALAATFADEAEVVRASLPDTVRTVWTSPSSRCTKLAEWLAGGKLWHGRDAHATPEIRGLGAVRTEARLMELDFGAWENRRWESFRSPQSEAWAQDPWRLAPPGGESGVQLWARVAAVRNEILGTLTTAPISADGAPVVVVTHAGVIRAWLGLARGLSWTESLALTVDHGTWVEVDGAATSGISRS